MELVSQVEVWQSRNNDRPLKLAKLIKSGLRMRTIMNFQRIVNKIVASKTISLKAGPEGDDASEVIKKVHVGDEVEIDLASHGKIKATVEKISKQVRKSTRFGDTVETMNEQWEVKQLVVTLTIKNDWAQRSKITFYGKKEEV